MKQPTEHSNLFNRTIKSLEKRRTRILNGEINVIPWGLPRFEKDCPGIEKGKNLLFTANSKVGKTQITDSLCVFNPIYKIINGDIDIRLKIFYFSLEMTAEQKMLSCFSNVLYILEGVRISPTDLKSTRSDKPLSQETLDLIIKHKKYFDKIEECVEFIDDIRHPNGIYNVMRTYALKNGTIHYKTINIKGVDTQIEDYYIPNDPEEYVFCIVDHISLISTEKRNGTQMDLRESIGALSSDYFVKLRNRFGYNCIAIQQQSQAQESIENKKHNRLKPTLDGLGENKTTQRDFDLILGLFSPFRHEIPSYYNYDITYFKDNIRFLEILGGRDGGAGVVTPLYFDGAVNYFRELPLPSDDEGMSKVKKFIDNVRKEK